MADPLNVQLRVRLRYEAEGEARKALGDLDQIQAKAQQLGASGAGARVGRELQGVATQAGAAKREMVDLGQAAARFGATASFGKVGSELRGLVTPAQTVKREISEIVREVRRLDDASLGNLDRWFNRTTRSAAELQRQTERARRTHRHDFANEALGSAGFGGALRFGMSGAGLAGVAAGGSVAGIGGSIAAATRQAISFESAMGDVRKAVDEMSPEKFAALESAILRTSRTTGLAKEQMAALVAQAGFSGRPTEDLARFAEFGAKAAVAFGLSAEDTGDKLAKLGNVFKLNQGGIEDLANGVNVLGDNTASKERQIIKFLTDAGENGKALGLTAFQTGAIGAAAISAGKDAEVASTAFNAFATRIGDAKNQSKEFQQGLRVMGLSSRQIKAELSQNPFEAVMTVLDRLNKVQPDRKLEVANKLFGLEQGPNFLAFAGQIDAIRVAYAKVQDEAARAGSVERAFKIFDATTQRDIDRAGSAMASWATKVGQRFLPVVREAAHYVERLFGGMTKGIERFERAQALAEKVAKGGTLTKDEQAEVDKNPRLKSTMDGQLRIMREREAEADRNRRFEAIPGGREGQEQFQRRQREMIDGPSDGPTLPASPMSLPGLGRRSDLTDAARISLASYTDEVERGLERTERIVRDSAQRMREELGLKSRVEIAGGRFGVAGGARIENAAYGGGGIGGGLGGARGGSVALPPGRFGIPMPGGGGSGRAPSGGDAERFGSAGAGLSDAARERAMQYHAGLRAGGLDAVHANALMGHAAQETGGTFSGSSWNAKEGAGGMLQYRGNRLANLKRFAAEQGKPWTDPHVQGQFASAEQRMDPYEAKRARSFMEATDIDTATREAGRNVVRFGDDTGPYRQRMARAFQDGSAYEALPGSNAKARPLTTDGPVRANLMRGQFGAPGSNLTKVMTPGGKSAWVHKEAAPSFQAFVNDLESKGYKINDFGGHNHRNVRGGAHLSQHAFGNAIDINPSRNPLGTSRTDMPAETRELAKKYGLIWGMDWKGRKDPMHFEWNGTRPWLQPGNPVAGNDQIRMPQGWRERLGADAPQAAGPRFNDPSKMRRLPTAAADPAGGAGGGMPGSGAGAAVTQHFHGGFNEQEVAWRSMREQNSSIRKEMAGALHDIGRPA